MTSLRRFSIGAILCAAVSTIATTLAAQDAVPTKPRLHRLLVPQRDIPGMVGGMLPMRTADFERGVRDMHGSPGRRPPFSQADFFARLEDGNLVAGRGRLTFSDWVQPGTFVSLIPARLAIHAVEWSGSGRSAAWGTDGGGTQLVRAGDGQTVAFSWSLAGHSANALATSFDVSLPSSEFHRLVLQLPENFRPLCPSGIVSQRTVDELDDQLVSVIPFAIDPQQSVWLIETGSRNQTHLEVVRAHPIADAASVRQTLAYQLTQLGVELQAQIRLDLHAPMDRLEVRLDAPLRLASARLGDQPLVIREATAAGAIVLEFPQSLGEGQRDIELTALAPLVLGNAARLPGLRVNNTRWTHGSATVAVPDFLELTHIEPIGYVETNVEPLPSPQSGESREYQAYREEASLEVLVRQRRTNLDVDSACALRFSNSMITAEHVSLIGTDHGQRFDLTLVAAPGWSVDTIESIPPGGMTWTAAERNGERLHHLRIHRPLDAESRLRMLVRAHRQFPVGAEPLRGDALRPIRFSAADSERRTVALLAESPYQLNLLAPFTLEPRSMDELSVIERDLIEWPPGAVLYRDDARFRSLTVAVRQERPKYDARINVQAVLDGTTLSQQYSLECAPQNIAVSRLVVRITGAEDTILDWRLNGRSDGILASRRVSADSQPGTADWEIALRTPQLEPFRIEAFGRSEVTWPAEVGLASVRSAGTQEATLTVAATDGVSFTVAGATLRPIPPPDDVDALPSLRAHYRYHPAQDVAVTVKRRAPEDEPAMAWVWHSHMNSYFNYDGTGTHWAAVEIENLGTRQTRVRLPNYVTLRSVVVAGVEIALPGAGLQRNTLDIPLPRNERHCTVVLKFVSRGKQLATISSVRGPWPVMDIPQLRKSWTVWLPPAYRLLDSSQIASLTHPQDKRWDHRLFGFPLLRWQRRPFNVASSSDWASLTNAWQASSASRATAAQMVSTLDRLSDEFEQGETWANVVSQYVEKQRAALVPIPALAIDTTALLLSGVTPNTSVRQRSRGRDSLTERLTQPHGLAVIVGRESAVLTSLSALATYPHRLFPTANPHVVVSSREPVAADVRARRLVPAMEWSRGGQRPVGDFAPAGEEVGKGWVRYQIDVGQTPVPELGVFHSTNLQALGWAGVLIVFGAATWLGKRSSMAPLAILILSVAVCLLVPSAYGPLGRGFFWGALLAVVHTVLRRGDVHQPPRAQSGTISALAKLSGLLVALFGVPVTAEGQQPAGLAEADLTVGERTVVIPIDDSLEPAGDMVYVAPRLYDQLHREALPGVIPGAWIANSAEYEITLKRGEVGTPDSATCRVTLEITVRHAGAEVVLPFSQAAVPRLEVLVNSQPNDLRRDNDKVIVPIARPGNARLELQMDLGVTSNQDGASLFLPLPAISQSQLTLIAPGETTRLEVTGCLGEVIETRIESPLAREIRGQVGPSTELHASWSFASEPIPQADIEVTKLQWLHIQPNSVTYDVVHLVSIQSGTLDELRLKADPFLFLQEFGEDQPISTYTVDDNESGQVIDLNLDRSYRAGDYFSIRTHFLVPGVSGLGRVTIPRVEVDLTGPQQQWLAVSVPPWLAADAVSEGRLQSIAGTEFADTWQYNEPPPTAAYRIGESAEAIHVSVQPKPASVRAEEEVFVSLGFAGSVLAYQAQLDPAGPQLRQRLRVEGDFTVLSASALAEGENRLLRWTRGQDNVVTLFFSEPLGGVTDLELRLRLPHGGGNQIPIAQVKLLDAVVERTAWHVYRQNDTAVELGSTASPEAEPEQRPADFVGRYLASFPSGSLPASFEVALNRPAVAGTLTTRLLNDNDEWTVLTELDLTVQEGTVDAIQLEVPSSWQADLELLPEMPFRLVPAASAAGQVLRIEPQQEVAGSFRCEIRTALSSTPSQGVRVPEIDLLPPPHAERFSRQRYLIVPTRNSELPLEWETSGLERLRSSNERVSRYRVVASEMRAELSETRNLAGQPQVHLADYYFVWSEDGSCRGVASFDVEPGGRQFCDIALPSGYRLIQASVRSLPAVEKAVGDNQWAIRLQSDQDPQRIDVVFDGVTQSARGRGWDTVLAAPTIVGFPVRHTLWTVEPAGGRRVLPLLEHTQVSAAKQATIRQGVASQFLTETAPRVSSTDVPKLASWAPLVKQHTILRCSVMGEASTLAVKNGAWSSSALRLLDLLWVTLCMVLTAAAATMIARPLREWAIRWPHVVGVLGGLVLWFFVEPGVFGILVVVLFAASGSRPIWGSSAT